MAVRRPPALDRIDIKILAALQRDGRSTVQKLAGLVGLTPRPCLERVRRLEASGIIAGYRAVIAIERLSKPVTIFAEIALEKLGRSDRLEKRLRSIEELVECWEVSGDLDYLARFVCADVARYEALTTDLIDDPELGVRRITSHIALRPVVTFSGYPASLLSPSGQGGKPRYANALFTDSICGCAPIVAQPKRSRDMATSAGTAGPPL